MKKLLFIIALVLTGTLAVAQNATRVVKEGNNESLSQTLWAQVHSCHSLFEDMDRDGQPDNNKIIDDAKNGYLKVSGSFSTCGCTCTNTVGAFPTVSNQYVFVKKYAWDCSWKAGINASDSLTKLFPLDFEDAFFKTKIDNPKHLATFYLDMEIPRSGTDTKVTIKPIPLGLKVENENSIAFGYGEENRFYYSDKLIQIRNIVANIENEETIEYLLNNDFDRIAKGDNKMIETAIGGGSDKFENKEALAKVLRELKPIYDVYAQIKYESLILGWDKHKGNFYIKEKIERTHTDSFLNFLKSTPMWAATC